MVLDPALATDADATGDVERLVERLDAVLLTGGPDVAPDCYNEATHAAVYGTDDVVDGFELALTRAAIDAELPLLAVCRGIQVLNVACSGSLHQHIPELPGVSPHGRPGEAGGEWLHTVTLEPDSRLAQVMGTDRPACSCHHHQSVDRVGDGLRVVGRADDGIVEAIESAGSSGLGFVLGVQWHPEDTAADDRAQQRLFDSLVEAGRATG